MIPSLRQQFNESFTPDKYQAFLRRVDEVSGTHVQFRLSETPCFFPKALIDRMASDGQELIRQLVDNPAYLSKSDEAVPAEFKVPNEPDHPMFVQVDFGLVRDAAGELQPKLVELQAFPSLYAYQGPLAEAYVEAYELAASGFRLSASGGRAQEAGSLKYLLSGLETASYRELLRRAIVANHDPENVILMEIDPAQQKTLPDFLLTEKLLGIATVSITDIEKRGNELFYESQGRRTPIRRIYNRAIVDELVRKKLKLAFNFTDDLNVEWAGHPNWYFRMSKFSLPYLHHQCVPKTSFLDRVEPLPQDLENYVIKPLFSFAGLGVILNPKKEDLANIPKQKRSQYILQERMHFEPVIETPLGGT